MSEPGKEYIVFARQLCSNGCYAKAVDLFLMAFEKNPQLKTTNETEFRATVMKLNEVLAAANKIEDIFSNFERAINMFPGNVYLMNEIGKYLYKFGYYEEAWYHFQKALEIEAGFVGAEKHLNSMKNLLVERWHFRMLNDKIRNGGYRAAVHKTVEPSVSTVLDLGSGTGLLAMFASECNPKHVMACDSSEVMCNLANCIVQDNKGLGSIAIINEMSTSLTPLEENEKRSLLVTELFDAGLFGEHILASLAHAWQNLLTNSAQVIPHSAELFVLGAHSDMLNAKYKLQPNAKSLLNIKDCNVHISLGDDTYDCEDVYLYQDFKYMTEATSVVKVDFTNINDIQDKQNRTEPYSVELKSLKSGEINFLIGWFNLYLTADITITTDPRNKSRANAWQQAVFFDYTLKVKENETYNIDFLMNAGKINVEVEHGSNISRISPETLRFLNDIDFISKIKKCIGMAYVYLGQLTEMCDITVVDLCPFPVFGMFLLKRGIRSLTCYAKTEHDQQFLVNVFRENGIDLHQLTILVGDEWTQGSFAEEKYHAIFSNILHVCGDIDVHCKEIADVLKSTHLIQGGLFMPSSIVVVAQIVSSDWLDINSRVFDDNVGLKVSSHINKYQASQNFCLDFTNLEYTPMTDPIVLGDCNHLSSHVVNVPIKNDGDANAILCWYSIELMHSLESVSTKRSNSFIAGTAFMANPIIPMAKGNTANILCCVDPDGSFKLLMDLEST